jgi:hypothetical protein
VKGPSPTIYVYFQPIIHASLDASIAQFDIGWPGYIVEIMNPESLLFTELDGTRSSVQDVIYSGLEIDYSERYPGLLRLLEEGEPAHRLYACMMLAAWGVPEGFGALTAWARDPDSAPWAGQPVTYDRLFGADAAFEMLAWSLWASGGTEHAARSAALRVEAARTLLGIYHRAYFDRTMALLLNEDRELAASLGSEIRSAVARTVEASLAPSQSFDMASQAAFLLGELARLDDEGAARGAEALISAHPDKSRCLREVAHSLGDGSGPATRAILERLAQSPYAAVREDALASLKRRGEE